MLMAKRNAGWMLRSLRSLERFKCGEIRLDRIGSDGSKAEEAPGIMFVLYKMTRSLAVAFQKSTGNN